MTDRDPRLLPFPPLPPGPGARRAHGDDEKACFLCGRRLRDERSAMVHVVAGGGSLWPAEEPWPVPASDLGWWGIGPECLKRLPAAYVGRR